MRIAYISLSGALLFGLGLAAGRPVAGEQYVCPMLPPAGISLANHPRQPPMVDGAMKFVGGAIMTFEGAVSDVSSPVWDVDAGERLKIGTLADMGRDDALEALDAAVAAWDGGQGEWPQLPLARRIAAIEALVVELKKMRSSLVDVLMWEIAKTADDAAKEFDRTMDFIAAVIAELRREPSGSARFAQWEVVSGVGVRVRRGPIGVMLGLSPFNYPLNEMYAILIPALLMGNTAVLKLPAVGGLVHVRTAAAFARALPAGVINFISGSGRATLGPVMESGKVDVLGFIGGTKGADALIKAHPSPHRLRVFAQLEAKNLGVVLADADLDAAAEQCVLGALSYNGQRCTAIKLIMVHDSVADAFVAKLIAKVDALKRGMPWEDGVAITPLPEPSKPLYLEELIADAVGRGATLANEAAGGGALAGALFTPAVLDYVTPDMRVFHEEQFGPLVPVARFGSLGEVQSAIKASWNGQQAAVFTTDAASAAPVVDMLATVVGRVNINAQCGRSPDVVPFSARRSSGVGTMSVSEALRAFSVETVVAYPAKDAVAGRVAKGLDSRTAMLAEVA